MDDAAFRDQAEAALNDLFRRLAAAGDRYGFEPDLANGALVIEFDEPPAKFVVSPNAPVRQIWVSANLTSYKLDWDASAGVFQLSGQPLAALVAQAMSTHLGEAVTL